MKKISIFISSVQAEFAEERKQLANYLTSDPLLGRFFNVFLFELLPSMDKNAPQVFLDEAGKCQIYLGLFGKEYGTQNTEGISPTELEYNEATRNHRTRLIFITRHSDIERHPKTLELIKRAQEVVIRKAFSSYNELRTAVYAALVKYLEENELIRTGPFDASINREASIRDIDTDSIDVFIEAARVRRGFPFSKETSVFEVLAHLNLYRDNGLTNAALLLFGNNPQRFFLNSEVRCAQFPGTISTKPIISYKVFKGNLFSLVDQASEYILSKLDFRIGTRSSGPQVTGEYEIPREIIAEAVVNAIAHRDYTNGGSVQVILKDLELAHQI